MLEGADDQAVQECEGGFLASGDEQEGECSFEAADDETAHSRETVKTSWWRV